MDAAYIQQRVHEILEGQIAMGAGDGGVMAGATEDWVTFLKFFRAVAKQESVELSYKEAMKYASPVWKDLQAQGMAPLPKGVKPRSMKYGKVQKAALAAYPRIFDAQGRVNQRGQHLTRNAQGKVIQTTQHLMRPPAPLQVEDVSPDERQDYDSSDVFEPISPAARERYDDGEPDEPYGYSGEGFSLSDLTKAVGKYGPAAKRLASAALKEYARAHAPRRPAPARRRGRGSGDGGCEDVGGAKGRWVKTKGKYAPCHSSKGKFMTERQCKAKAVAAKAAKARKAKKARGGGGASAPAYMYHCELRKFKAKHPRWDHATAVQKFKKDWPKIKARLE